MAPTRSLHPVVVWMRGGPCWKMGLCARPCYVPVKIRAHDLGRRREVLKTC